MFLKDWLLDMEKRIKVNLLSDQEELKKMPSEQYIVKRLGNQLYLYKRRKEVSKDQYRYKYMGNVKKMDAQFVKDIARKEVLEARINEAKRNLSIIEKLRSRITEVDYKKIYDKYKAKDFYLLGNEDKMAEKVLINYSGEEKRVLEWLKDNISRGFREAELKHMTSNGIRVRSKSELLIATALEERNLAFKYESEFKVNGKTVFRPDFAIIRPYDMKEIYWEHFGLMGDSEYEEKTIKKLIYYQDKGWCLWDNLIVSFDSDKGSFNMQTINKIIDMFLFSS